MEVVLQLVVHLIWALLAADKLVLGAWPRTVLVLGERYEHWLGYRRLPVITSD